MNRILAVALALAGVSATPRAARAEQKLAYVDLDELKKMKTDLDKQASILKPEAMQAKQGELQQKLIQLQETYMRLQKDLQEKEAAETGKIFKRMQGIIKEIAEKEGVTFVLEKNSGILYAPPALDLTNELIRKFNAAGGAGK